MTPHQILEQEKIELCTKKTGLQLKLSGILLRIRGKRLEQSLYNQLCREQKFLKSAIHDVETRIGEIKIEMLHIKADALAATVLKPKKGDGSDPLTMTRLHTMRDKYHILRGDPNATSEIRVIAYDVFLELDRIIQAGLLRE